MIRQQTGSHPPKPYCLSCLPEALLLRVPCLTFFLRQLQKKLGSHPPSSNSRLLGFILVVGVEKNDGNAEEIRHRLGAENLLFFPKLPMFLFLFHHYAQTKTILIIQKRGRSTTGVSCVFRQPCLAITL